MIRVVLHVETLAEVEKLLAAAGDAGLAPGGRWDDLDRHGTGGLIWNGALGPAVVIPADPAEAAAAAQALIEEDA